MADRPVIHPAWGRREGCTRGVIKGGMSVCDGPKRRSGGGPGGDAARAWKSEGEREWRGVRSVNHDRRCRS